MPSERVELTTDWTLNDARYRELVTEDGDTLSGARVFNTARYVGTAALDLGRVNGPRLRLATNVVGPYTPFDEPGVELPAYALLHVSAGVPVGHARLEVGVRNVFDRVYPELRAGGWVSPGQPRSLTVTLSDTF